MVLKPYKAKGTSTASPESEFCTSSSSNIGNLEIDTSTNQPRLLRLISPINTAVHDLILIDSPKFHFVLDFGLNVEVYHLTIRGANLGSYDGIDAIGSNYHIHDNEVPSPETQYMAFNVTNSLSPGHEPR
jgi:hypothetical protein